MGKKAKSSRKGKKAWRANISTEDIEEYFENNTKDALSGGSLSNAPSESLFYVDKSRDLSVKRKIDKSREKVLRCDSLLQRNPFVQPVPSSIQKKKKAKKNVKAAKTTDDKNDDGQKAEGVLSSSTVDLWDGQGEDAVKITKKMKPSIIPAVEVELPGCSFNPAHESHQDALALAVADEMQKIYRDELGPEPVPLTVPGEVIDEEEKYFLDADGEDEDDQNENLIENGDADADADPEKRPHKAKLVTRVEMNRRIRRKEHLRAEAEAKKVEKLSKEIDCLPDILQEIAKEDEEKNKRHVRRIVAKKEHLKAYPPRLGKHKFVPAPLQVLLSEEKTGSLRQLKGCCTLVKDRFKSLEKRGLVVPSKKSARVNIMPGAICEFVSGDWKTQNEIAELYEQEENLKQAINYYEKAADLFQSEEVTTSANQCKQKIAQFSAQLKQYPKAIEIYKEIAQQSLTNYLLKYGVKGHLLNAGICQLCKGDGVAIISGICEYKWLVGLVAAIDEEDIAKYTGAIKEFDSMTQLDAWKTTLLLRVKEAMKAK